MNIKEANKIIENMFNRMGFILCTTVEEAREARKKGYSFGYNPHLTDNIADPKEREKFVETYSFGK